MTKIGVFKEQAKRRIKHSFGNKRIPLRYIKILENIDVIEQQLKFYHFSSSERANQLLIELMYEVNDNFREKERGCDA